MAIGRFSPPEDWEDWTTVVLGVWAAASPWLLQLSDPAAMENMVAVGFLVLVGEVFTFYTPRIWEEWINIVLGAWLVVSSWLLGLSDSRATANAIIVGALLIAVGCYEMWKERMERQGRSG
jgi:O-antigen ligase